MKVLARSYGQYCGLARAAEVVGERWALLVIRDLMLGPRRFGELMAGLPGAPKTVITARLKELEAAGVVQRTLLARPANGVAYELTPYGRQLGPSLATLGAWGSQLLEPEPPPGEVITATTMIQALLVTFDRDAATDLHLAVKLTDPRWTVHVHIGDSELAATQEFPGGDSQPADLVVRLGFEFHALITGAVSVRQAVRDGRVVVVRGQERLLRMFVGAFSA